MVFKFESLSIHGPQFGPDIAKQRWYNMSLATSELYSFPPREEVNQEANCFPETCDLI